MFFSILGGFVVLELF